jgi:hypothetical protein
MSKKHYNVLAQLIAMQNAGLIRLSIQPGEGIILRELAEQLHKNGYHKTANILEKHKQRRTA